MPIQIWGLSPNYVLNQGPVYTGPGYTTMPTYEGEASTARFPYVASDGYPPVHVYSYYGPYGARPYWEPPTHRAHHHN